MPGRQQSEICCPTTVLILVVHGGSVLDPGLESSVRKSDVTTFRGAFESVMRTHYPYLIGHVAIKCVPCPGVCTEALAVLSSLSPYRYVYANRAFSCYKKLININVRLGTQGCKCNYYLKELCN